MHLLKEIKASENIIGVIAVDARFSPVQKVNYVVEHTRVGQITDYDKLVLGSLDGW